MLGGWLSNNSWGCRQTFISHHKIIKDDQKLLTLTKTSQVEKTHSFEGSCGRTFGNKGQGRLNPKETKLPEGGKPPSVTTPGVWNNMQSGTWHAIQSPALHSTWVCRVEHKPQSSWYSRNFPCGWCHHVCVFWVHHHLYGFPSQIPAVFQRSKLHPPVHDGWHQVSPFGFKAEVYEDEN